MFSRASNQLQIDALGLDQNSRCNFSTNQEWRKKEVIAGALVFLSWTLST